MISDNLAWAFLLTFPLTGPAIILGLQDQWQTWKLKKLAELVGSMCDDELKSHYVKACTLNFDILLKHKYLPIKFKVCNEIWIYTLEAVAKKKGVILK